MSTNQMPIRICFVCLGNICRSPLAEGIARQKLKALGLEDRIEVDSMGTGSWHIGHAPDPRSQAICRAHGIDISAHRAQQTTRANLSKFDLILACDTQNYADLERLTDSSRLDLLMHFAPGATQKSVPDPYYGSEDGFETVFNMCEAAVDGLINEIRQRYNI